MKKALLVGICSYSVSKKNLRGCVNDVLSMNDMLTRNFGFEDIRILTDIRANSKNIIDGIRWLKANAVAGDVLVFYFAGHGSFSVLKHPDGRLKNYREAALCTYELNWLNPMSFSEVDQMLAVPDGINMTCILDCCHSGYKNGDKFIAKSNYTLLSSCSLIETAKDIRINGIYRGVFTFYMNQILKEEKFVISGKDLIMKTAMRLRENGYKQTPQIHGIFLDRPVFENLSR